MEQDMNRHTGFLATRGLWLAAVLAGASALLPVAAEAQARGTVQVYAQVVDTKVSSDGLRAAKQALRGTPSSSSAVQHETVSTLAHVTVAYATERRPGVVLTIDYSKN
jgi:hypothetical protein